MMRWPGRPSREWPADLSPPDGVQVIAVRGTNVYLLPAGDGFVVVDSGPGGAGTWEALRSALTALGAKGRLRLVIVTHHHLDHVGLARRLQIEFDAPVALHADSAAVARLTREERQAQQQLQQAFRRQHGADDGDGLGFLLQRSVSRLIAHEVDRRSARDEPVVADRLLDDREILMVEGRSFQVLHTPGHCRGHLVVYEAARGLLFSGDHILPRITPNPNIEFAGGTLETRTRSLPDYINSLRRVRDLPASMILPAHEGPMHDLPKAVDRLLHHHEQRERRVWQILQDLGGEHVAAGQILSRLFPRVWGPQRWLALNEVVGHLDLLEDAGRVTCEHDGDRYIYSVR